VVYDLCERSYPITKKEMVKQMAHYDDELDDFLIEKFKLIEETPPRDPARARHGRHEYMRKIKYFQAGKPIFSLASLLNRKPWQGLFSQRPSLVPFAAALLLIFGLVFGTWGTVQAAQNSLPNDLLYPVKLTSENLRLAFTPDAESRISLLTTYTDRRLAEAKALVLQGKSIPKSLPEKLDDQYEALFAATASLDDAAMLDALNGLQIHLRDQDKDMTNAMTGLPEGLDPQLEQLRNTLTARHHLAQMGVVDPNTFQYRLRHRSNATLPITGTLTTTLTTTPTLMTTPEITMTRTISPGLYGPGPCENPGDCEAPGYGQGPFKGTPPVPEDDAGYGPGPGYGPRQPTATPTPYDPLLYPTGMPYGVPKSGGMKKGQ
jgi:hypothetical protein